MNTTVKESKKLSSKAIASIAGVIIAALIVGGIVWGSLAYVNNQKLIEARSAYNNSVSQYCLVSDKFKELKKKASDLLNTTKGKITNENVWNELKKSTEFSVPSIKPASLNTISAFNKATGLFKAGTSELDTHISTLDNQIKEVNKSHTSYMDSHKDPAPTPAKPAPAPAIAPAPAASSAPARSSSQRAPRAYVPPRRSYTPTPRSYVPPRRSYTPAPAPRPAPAQSNNSHEGLVYAPGLGWVSPETAKSWNAVPQPGPYGSPAPGGGVWGSPWASPNAS